MVVFNNPGYYHALDNTFSVDEYGPPSSPYMLDDGSEFKTELGLKQMGTSANPFQNQVQALQAKIREGASKVELEFPGAGKGSSQSPTPESYGTRERLDMRELAKATDIQTSTHATFQRQGFSGFDPQRGFSDEARYQSIKEIKKAIEFAAEATTGGAVVFHTGEWQRPIIETWGKGKDKNAPEVAFRGFEEEDRRAVFYMVDDRTGEFVSAIRKDKELFRPKYRTAKDLTPDRVGRFDSKKGGILEADDYMDINKDYIDETQQNRLFERVPVWDSEHTKFEVEKFDWKRIEQETDKWNRKHPEKQLRPEQMFIQIEVENQILQAKGHSLFYAQQYEDELYQSTRLREASEFYNKLDKNIPESDKWKLMTQRRGYEFTTPQPESIPDQLRRELKQIQDRMRHTHEASAAADAQASEREEQLKRVKPIDEYGIIKSTEGIARAGMYAWEQTELHKKDLKNPIYVAPENWQAQMYGGHPDELITLVKGARERLANELVESRGKDAEEAKKLAAQHIKSTIDIGHLNLWRQHFVARPGENEESRNKRFNKWAIDKTKDMIKAGIVGHVHLADNFGWDDEHVTPGEGNAPIREFVQALESAGFKDFIVEPGSFNPLRALPDTLRNLGNPVYAAGTPFARPMGHFREANFGYAGPSLYIVGGYSPSNEWKLWSEVPME
jgi:sugar phosphate isomerase/epimerase